MIKNVLTLNESNDGNRIKQGDQSVMRYTLTDTSNDNLELDEKQATVYLYTDKGVAYKQETTVNNNIVDVVINEIIPIGHYTLEIVVDNKYIFPSDNKTKIEITSSILGKGTTEIKEQNLYGDLLEYGITNDMFKSFKGEDGLDGKPLTYDDLTDEQKQDLASRVPVKDIPDSHIINVMEQDYANSIGELDILFVNWKNQDVFYPVVFRKSDYIENPVIDYEKWKTERANYINDFIMQTGAEDEKELYKNAMEVNENSFLGFSLPIFPIYTSIQLPEYSVNDTKYITNNYLIQTGLIGIGDKGKFTVRLAYNGRPLEQNKLEIILE